MANKSQRTGTSGTAGRSGQQPDTGKHHLSEGRWHFGKDGRPSDGEVSRVPRTGGGKHRAPGQTRRVA